MPHLYDLNPNLKSGDKAKEEAPKPKRGRPKKDKANDKANSS